MLEYVLFTFRGCSKFYYEDIRTDVMLYTEIIFPHKTTSLLVMHPMYCEKLHEYICNVYKNIQIHNNDLWTI